jgi:hypothetical protein
MGCTVTSPGAGRGASGLLAGAVQEATGRWPYNQVASGRERLVTGRGTVTGQVPLYRVIGSAPNWRDKPGTLGEQTISALVAQGIEHRFPNGLDVTAWPLRRMGSCAGKTAV